VFLLTSLAGNGYFAYGAPYTIDRSVGVPLAVWPGVLACLAAGAWALRRGSPR